MAHYTKSSWKKTVVKIITWIIVIMLILAVFSPFISYIFTSAVSPSTNGATSITGEDIQ